VGRQKFQENLIRLSEQTFFKNQNAADSAEMDKFLCQRATQEPDVEKLVDKFHEVLEEACGSSFQTSRALKSKSARRTVPWWSEELTIMRNSLNALRRRFQRTKDIGELRTQHRIQYAEAKTNFATKIRKAKSLSWKEYCNTTTYINPWNEAYRLTAGKRRSTTQITTLRKPDGTLIADLQKTLKHMLEHFAPEDNQHDDSDLHQQARTLSMEPIYTEDDKEFTVQEIRNAVASLGGKGTRSRRHHGGNLQTRIQTFSQLHNGTLQWMPQTRDILNKMEATQGDIGYKTRERKQRRSIQISGQ
jgi:hypothetical protein